jgi:hypothetical protein
MFEEIKLGPCNITYGDLAIKHTDAGVKLHVEPLYREIKTARHGSSIIDHRITGWTIKAIVPMKQTDWLSIKSAATFLQQVGDGASKALVDRALGTSMRGLAKELTMHPVENAAEDVSDDVTLWLAGPITPIEMGYDYEGERVYNVEFLAYPKEDDNPAIGNYMAIGDPAATSTLYTITFIAAAGATPVQGVTIALAGTGNKKITNAEGKAFWLLPAGDYVWMAEKEPYDMVTNTVTVSADADVNVAMVTS